MLIISRKLGESFSIGNDITVKIINYDRGQVSIGIDAPKTLAILRDDVKVSAPKMVNDSDLNKKNIGNFQARLIKGFTGECTLDMVHRDWIDNQDIDKHLALETFLEFCKVHQVKPSGNIRKNGNCIWAIVLPI